MTKKEAKALDAAITREYLAQGSGVQINVMDIPALYAYVRGFVKDNGPETLPEAVRLAIVKFRRN